ncbi:hypothetical protein CC1G_00218 [Coprinopsis cinerea okayama7|uniref:Xylanolytic transcriptional activator regulatory domain-containing protein n=1 Tax=Coprinopsis cinerea (strain Okayama-7 / 130 / ATCC MYA-4618 / FGSC 9003) TaxID=240176 RepID=A8NX68_COPC7|nr:hypothetical protein CC1G_00218 [Coprinopsis cinerea okayama7\|eukprot:XP_001837082.2 hypothetical protein CC1G_00218 [Coprinopsis cinerea okayama7\
MGHRISQLEEALATFQSSHPLLQEELLSIKSPFGQNLQRKDKVASDTRIRIDQTTAAFGTLSIGDQGEGKYFGPSAGAEAGANLNESETDDDEPTEVSVHIARILSTEGNFEKAMDILFDHLPEQPRAWALCETYLEQAAWASKPIKRDEVIEDILSPTYKALKTRHSSDAPVASFSPHKLSVLYMIFAIGALVDLTLEPCSKEAENYYYLSRACLSLRSVFDSPEVSTVQALLLMGGYHGWAGTRYTVDSSWGLVSLASKTAQSLGLHRDPSRFNLNPKMVERRRMLFWELYSSEQLYSLALGRPPAIRPSYIDCQFPMDEELQDSGDSKSSVGYYQWKYGFIKDVLATILEKTVTANPPTYETILDLDRRVRERALPPQFNTFLNPEDGCTPGEYMRHCLLGQMRVIALLYIHRNFFAQAILDSPENPLRSPYAPSFLATYRCASGVIKATMNHYEKFPELCARWWGVWTHLFSAAMIVGCIVTRSPSCSLASSAYIELGLACDLFEKGCNESRRAKSGLAILLKLRRRASEVYSRYISGDAHAAGGILSTGQPDYGEDELALFGGQTKVLVSKMLSQYRKRKGRSSSSSSALPTSASTPSTSGSEPDTMASPTADVHPRLVEYLSMYPPSNHSSPPHSDLTPDHMPQNIQLPEKMTEYQQCEHYEPPPNQDYSWWDQGQTSTGSAPVNPVNGLPHYYSDPMANPSGAAMPPNFGLMGQAYSQGGSNISQLADLGMMMTGDLVMDQQWLSFMRDSGVLEGGDPSTSQRRPAMFDTGDMTGIL